MKRRHNITVTILVIAVFLINSTVCAASGESSAPGNLYALSAVLMDGDSGRVLYEKEGETPRANASTTKVLTCILALENGKGDDYVQVSSMLPRSQMCGLASIRENSIIWRTFCTL